MGRNVIIFGADMSPSVHIDNKGKYILILGDGQHKNQMALHFTAEAEYSINFTQSNKFAIYGSSSFLFVNATKIYQFKAKGSEIKKISPVFMRYFKRFYIY